MRPTSFTFAGTFDETSDRNSSTKASGCLRTGVCASDIGAFLPCERRVQPFAEMPAAGYFSGAHDSTHWKWSYQRCARIRTGGSPCETLTWYASSPWTLSVMQTPCSYAPCTRISPSYLCPSRKSGVTVSVAVATCVWPAPRVNEPGLTVAVEAGFPFSSAAHRPQVHQ